MSTDAPFTPSPDTPLRVAVVGSGPSGFYVVQALLQAKDVPVRIDIFDALPAPYGLVRYGVAPDHQKIKSVTKVYARLADDDRVRLFGNVEIGRDLTLADLAACYHQIVFCTGAQTDRSLRISGEDLPGSHPATAFVAWYNGHPDFRDLTFDLDVERAVVVGVGNVAIDVARILSRSVDELRRTDIADHALEALAESKVRDVWLVGRRGPAQAAFSNKEIEEIGALEAADVVARPEETTLDALSQAELEQDPDRQTALKVEILQGYAREIPEASRKARRLLIRFLLSPTEILGDGRVERVRFVQNDLHRAEDGSLRPGPTERTEEIDAGILFRSVGYRGVPVPGVPFREDWGTIPHDEGRILDAPDGDPVLGLYTAGWIKRGPSGVIGTNRPDSRETATSMLDDVAAGRVLRPETPTDDAIPDKLDASGVRWVSFDAWKRLDAIEVARGDAQERPRVKFASRDEMLDALDDSTVA